MLMNSKTNDQFKNQRGLVSIMVTVIIMIILSLIVVGFSRLTRREQRQALDRQLSTQAYYAAETGINDAVEKINSGSVDMSIDYNSDCNQFMAAQSLDPLIDGAGGNVSYTCLFVDPTPPSLEYVNVDVNESKIVPISDKNDGPIDSITISWEAKDGGSNVSGCVVTGSDTPFPKYNEWNTPARVCEAGIMRVDLVPTPGGGINRNDLINKARTFFLYPRDGGSTSGSFGEGYGNQGEIKTTNCNGTGPRLCSFKVTGLGPIKGYTLRLKSIYMSSSVTITAEGGGVPLQLKGAQALVDATGKAVDVLRRVQVRVPISNIGGTFPEFAVQTVDTLCKKFSVAPGSYTDHGGCGPPP